MSELQSREGVLDLGVQLPEQGQWVAGQGVGRAPSAEVSTGAESRCGGRAAGGG